MITDLVLQGTMTISMEDLQNHFEGETTKVKEDLPFALRFWHRLGRCIWVEEQPELPLVVDVEFASHIFGQVICSSDQQVLDELGITQ